MAVLFSGEVDEWAATAEEQQKWVVRREMDGLATAAQSEERRAVNGVILKEGRHVSRRRENSKS